MWDGDRFVLGGASTRVLAYSTNASGWTDDLTDLHESEAGEGTHPIDVASRREAIRSLRRFGFPREGALLEIGCSSGFLLGDLRREFPAAELIGADVAPGPLERLGCSLPGVPLLQLDVLQSRFKPAQFDAIVALNVLEHIEDDTAALRAMTRLLKPGGILVLEVPQGAGLYDYYDKWLHHFRRYSRQDLLRKIVAAGLTVERTSHVGFLPYPPFWLIKKINRRRFGVSGDKAGDIEALVRGEIRSTGESKLLGAVLAAERTIGRLMPLPWGIRCTAVARAVAPPTASRTGERQRV